MPNFLSNSLRFPYMQGAKSKDYENMGVSLISHIKWGEKSKKPYFQLCNLVHWLCPKKEIGDYQSKTYWKEKWDYQFEMDGVYFSISGLGFLYLKPCSWCSRVIILLLNLVTLLSNQYQAYLHSRLMICS